MQNESKTFTKPSFFLLLSLVATLTLTVSVFSQKQDGKQRKPASQSKQEKNGKKERGNTPGTSNQGPPTGQKGEVPCPQDTGDEEPVLAANTGSGMRKWNPPNTATSTAASAATAVARQATGSATASTADRISYEVTNCAGGTNTIGNSIVVKLSVAAKGPGLRYYQIVIPADSGLTLVDEAAVNQVRTLNFLGECDVLPLTLTFRLSAGAVRRSSREFYVQWLKPVASGNIATRQAIQSVPTSGYDKLKAHRLHIVCK